MALFSETDRTLKIELGGPRLPESLPLACHHPALRSEPLRLVGVDEAGRGPWAGPVVAAAVLARSAAPPVLGVTDSKKLNEKQRELVYKELTQHPDIRPLDPVLFEDEWRYDEESNSSWFFWELWRLLRLGRVGGRGEPH